MKYVQRTHFRNIRLMKLLNCTVANPTADRISSMSRRKLSCIYPLRSAAKRSHENKMAIISIETVTAPSLVCHLATFLALLCSHGLRLSHAATWPAVRGISNFLLLSEMLLTVELGECYLHNGFEMIALVRLGLGLQAPDQSSQ